MKDMLKLAAFLFLDLVAINIIVVAANAASSPKAPTFFARRDYPGLYSIFVQIADTNGDGIPDLIASQIKSGYIEVLLGNGDGTFRPGPDSLTVATGTVSFAAADLNGDGKIDLALANGNGIVISTGSGNGAFQPGVLYPINDGGIGFLVIGDFNGDGVPDIATAGNTGVWLLTGKGNGTFNPAVLAVSLPGCSNIAAADFNQDGNVDLVVTLPNDESRDFAVLFGKGNGTFQPPQMFGSSLMPTAVAVGSLTPGGPPSIAVNDAFNNNLDQVDLYFGNGAGGFSGPKVVILPEVGRAGLLIGDVNGDGLPDLVSDNGFVAYGEGGGNFTKPVGYLVSGGGDFAITNAVLSDLRNNGLTDIVTGGGQGAVSVLLNVGKGVLEDGVWTSVTGGGECGVPADFNGDGKPDLAISTGQAISILLGTGQYATPFMAGTSIALAGGTGCPLTGDLNGDGIPDLLVPNNDQQIVAAYLNNGDGAFTLASTTPTPLGGNLVLGDFNHDGKLDFATSGNLLALGNGDGTFQVPTSIVASPPPNGFSGIAAGDINNDGWPDLVLTSNTYPDIEVFVLLNNHQGGFTQVPASFGAETVQPILADLNGDGNLDLVLEYTTTGKSSAYLGDGKGDFTFKVEFSGPVYLVADVNGDGVPDIGALATSTSDTLAIYLGEGGATYAAPFSIGIAPVLLVPSPGGVLVEDLHGQSPKSGLPDIVVPSIYGVQVLFNLTP